MVTDRVTVALDENARTALDDCANRTGENRSEVVRRALTFYATNFEAARAEVDANLEEYHRMLAGGEHVLLDVDFLHCFLEHAETDRGEPDPAFLDRLEQVAAYHATEYADRFSGLSELLDWLSLCGFLTAREGENERFHVVFPSASVRWFMLTFIERAIADIDVEVEVEKGVAKVLLAER